LHVIAAFDGNKKGRDSDKDRAIQEKYI